MKDKRHRIPSDFTNSNEKATLRSLGTVHRDSQRLGLVYALFGGAAIASYAGHLTRRLHDIDYVIEANSRKAWRDYFLSRGFIERTSPKSASGDFDKFDEFTAANRITHTLFPGRFRLINIDSIEMEVLFEYSLSRALELRTLRSLRSLDDSLSISVWAIPAEDLLISKLFPALEPNTIYDAMTLLSSETALDTNCLVSRVLSLGSHAPRIFENTRRLLRLYDNSTWPRLLSGNWASKIQSLVDALEQSLGQHVLPRSHDSSRTATRQAIVISHGPDCLDGVASAVCIARVYGPASVRVHFSHPSDIDHLIGTAFNIEGNDPQDLWITDISWKEPRTEDTLRALSSRGWRIFWIDHHANALERLSQGLETLCLAGYRITDRYSAARLTYEYLLDNELSQGRLGPLKEFERVVMLADDTDRWVHQLPGSRELALTVSAMTGTEAYNELLIVGSGVAYTPLMKRALERSKTELYESIQIALKTCLRRAAPISGLTVVGCICHGFVSEVADHLRKVEKEAIFVIYNSESRRISLRRSADCTVDCARLAATLGGGGHPAAAGFDLPDLDETIVQRIIEATSQALSRLA